MNPSIKLTAAKLPKMLSDLSHSNQFLKVFSLSCLGVLALTLVIVLILSSKAPVVLALTPEGHRLESAALPKAEDEIRPPSGGILNDGTSGIRKM